MTDSSKPRLCADTVDRETVPLPPLQNQSLDRRAGLTGRDYWLNRFEYHAPHGDQANRYGRIRATGRAMAEVILELAPDSAERTRALEALQLVTMLTNAAIACNEQPAA